MDKMESGFFLDLVDNTRDGFSYELLLVLCHKDIPYRRNLVTLIWLVVSPCDSDTSDDVPKYTESSYGFKFYNRNGDELFGIEDADTSPHIPDAPIIKKYSATQCADILSAQPLPYGDIPDEHAVDDSMYLSNALFVDRKWQYQILTSNTLSSKEDCINLISTIDRSYDTLSSDGMFN